MRSKLDILCEIYGFDDWVTALTYWTIDSVIGGICTNEGCDYTTDVEPDCSSGHCEQCDTPTVQSALVIEGII